ncbi:MAG: ribonuclease HII [Bacteroidia bacterium]
MHLLPYDRTPAGEAGIDEAGRGCLAGPVVAAAVILPPDFAHPLLRDSKQLSAAQRREVRDLLIDSALAWSIGMASARRIDEINILQATFEAMHEAIAGLGVPPAHLCIDGNRFRPYPGIAHTCQVKGDARFLHIAAASILAKTCRDELMEQLHETYPAYDWRSNKGYPTTAHRQAILDHGYTPYHRRSFRVQVQPTLFDV